MDLIFDNSEVLRFIKNVPMLNEEMMTTFFDNQKNILDNKEISSLSLFIHTHLDIFNKNVLNKQSFTIKNSWFQAYKKNSYHPLHIHGTEENKYSLIFYIQASENSARTIFFCPGYPYTPAMNKYISAKQGKLVLFPSFLPHMVELNNDEERIILSANIDFY